MDAVVFGDTAAAVIARLNLDLPAFGAFADVRVSGRVPNPRPAVFATVQRTGGSQRTVVSEDVQLTVEAWATRDDDAHDLAQKIRQLIRTYKGEVLAGITVYQVAELGGPQTLPDPLSDQPRCTFTVLMHVRGLTP